MGFDTTNKVNRDRFWNLLVGGSLVSNKVERERAFESVPFHSNFSSHVFHALHCAWYLRDRHLKKKRK